MASRPLTYYSRLNSDESLLQSTRNGVNWTFTYHGNVAGSIIGDERQSGLAPNRGQVDTLIRLELPDLICDRSELCTTVEVIAH